MGNSLAATAIDEGNLDGGGGRASVHLPGAPSIWFFVIGDLIIFGVYFVCFAAYRSHDLGSFLNSHKHLNQVIGIVNTIILLSSSLFVALGTTAAREGNTPDAMRSFMAALLIGVLFPLVKMFEWIPDISAGLTPGTNLFFMFFYVMTGLHLVHVLVGLTLMGFAINKLSTSREPPVQFTETVGMYWHMVDVLWLVLFAIFYLMR